MKGFRSFDKVVKNDEKNNPRLRHYLPTDIMLQKIGAKIALYRRHNNLTQIELAKKSGVPQSSIARIENGCNTSLLTLAKLSHAMNQKIRINIPA